MLAASAGARPFPRAWSAFTGDGGHIAKSRRSRRSLCFDAACGSRAPTISPRRAADDDDCVAPSGSLPSLVSAFLHHFASFSHFLSWLHDCRRHPAHADEFPPEGAAATPD